MDAMQDEWALRARAHATGAVFLAIVATIVVAGASWYLLAPMRWPSVQGEVLSSAFISSSGNDTWGASIEYAYEVDGRSFVSERLSLFRSAGKYDAGSGQWIWEDRRLVEEHPRGSAIMVYVDPSDPARSVVVAHANMPGLWGAGAVLGVLWVLAGSLCMRLRRLERCEGPAVDGWA